MEGCLSFKFAPLSVVSGSCGDILVLKAKLLKSLLNENGIIAIMTLFHPNSDEDFKQWWYRRDITHISFYTPKTLRQMAEMVGLAVLFEDNKNLCVLSSINASSPS